MSTEFERKYTEPKNRRENNADNIIIQLKGKKAPESHSEGSQTGSEMVNHPQHYNSGKYEVIDVLEDALTEEEFYGFCVGNCLKYLLRAKHKHETPVEDLKKCRWYLDKVLKSLEKNGI